MTGVPALYRGLCDDAAIFPPGDMPLPEALGVHSYYRTSDFAGLVGRFVCSAERLEELRATPWVVDPALELSLTVPGGPGALQGALAGLSGLPNVQLHAIEIALPSNAAPGAFFADLAACALDPAVDVYIEVPRDDRRTPVFDGIAAAGLRAKFRTGGVQAALYPSEQELGDAIRLACERDIVFKATAGVHHAVRNTDPATGFEQHGFLNVMLAAVAPTADVEALLALRDSLQIAHRVRELDPSVRSRFDSFGTCSIVEPLTDLIDLGLLPDSIHANGARA